MQKNIFFLFLFFPIFVFAANSNSFKEANYILGYIEGQDIKSKAYVLDIPSFKQGLLDGYSNRVPDSIEEQRELTNNEYIDWILSKQTSTFAPTPPNKKVIQRFSYFVGSDYGKDFKLKYFPLDSDSFTTGLNDSLQTKTPKYKIEHSEALKAFYNRADKLRKETENNKSMGLVQDQSFNNTLKRGITYSVISEGKGHLGPSKKSQVQIEYSLSELDKEHITNIKEKQTDIFNMQDLSEGIQIALLSMKKGEHTIFSIPTVLLFIQNESQTIATKTLFDVTLISILSSPEQKNLVKDKNTQLKQSKLNSKKILPKPKSTRNRK